MPLLKCILPIEAMTIMWEIHEDTCGNHVEGAIPDGQSPEAGLLLDNHKDRLYGVRPEMRLVPTHP